MRRCWETLKLLGVLMSGRYTDEQALTELNRVRGLWNRPPIRPGR